MPGHPLLGTPLYLIRHFCSPLHSAHPLRDVGTSRKVRVPAKLRCHLVGNTTLLEKVSMYFLSSSRHSKSISVLSFVIGVIIKILGLNCCRKRRRFWPPCPAPPPPFLRLCILCSSPSPQLRALASGYGRQAESCSPTSTTGKTFHCRHLTIIW